MEKEVQKVEESPKVNIHIDSLRATLKKMPNWKTSGLNGIHGFWFKKFTSIYDRLTTKINRCLQETNIPKWMTKGKTTLIQEDP